MMVAVRSDSSASEALTRARSDFGSCELTPRITVSSRCVAVSACATTLLNTPFYTL